MMHGDSCPVPTEAALLQPAQSELEPSAIGAVSEEPRALSPPDTPVECAPQNDVRSSEMPAPEAKDANVSSENPTVNNTSLPVESEHSEGGLLPGEEIAIMSLAQMSLRSNETEFTEAEREQQLSLLCTGILTEIDSPQEIAHVEMHATEQSLNVREGEHMINLPSASASSVTQSLEHSSERTVNDENDYNRSDIHNNDHSNSDRENIASDGKNSAVDNDNTNAPNNNSTNTTTTTTTTTTTNNNNNNNNNNNSRLYGSDGEEDFRRGLGQVADGIIREIFSSEDESSDGEPLPSLTPTGRREPDIVISFVAKTYTHNFSIGHMLRYHIDQVKHKITLAVGVSAEDQHLFFHSAPLDESRGLLMDCLPFAWDADETSIILQLLEPHTIPIPKAKKAPTIPTFYSNVCDIATNDLSCDQAGMLDSPYIYSLCANNCWTNPVESADDGKYLSLSKPVMYFLAHELKKRRDAGTLDSKKFLEQFHYTYKIDVGMLMGNSGMLDKVALHSLSGGEDAARRRKQRRRLSEEEPPPPERWCEPFMLKYSAHMESGQVEVLATPDGTHVFAPIQATGDGNCLMHAVSKAIFGVECWYKILRAMMIEELTAHPRYYCEYLGIGVKEYHNALKDAETYDRLGCGQVQRGQLLEDTAKFLSLIHVAALASCINRPITLYGPPELMAAGIGFNNQCGTFLPRKFIQQTPEWLKWASEHPPKDGQPDETDQKQESQNEYELAFEKGVPSSLKHLYGKYVLQDHLINGRRCWRSKNEYQFYLFWSPFWRHHKYDKNQAWQNQVHYDPNEARLLQGELITWSDLPLQLQRKFLKAIRSILPPAEAFDESAYVSRGMEVSEGRQRHLAAYAAVIERKTSEFIDLLRLTYGDVEDEAHVAIAVRRSLSVLTGGKSPAFPIDAALCELVSGIVSVRAMRGEWMFNQLFYPDHHNLSPSQVDWNFDENSHKKPGMVYVPHPQNPRQMSPVTLNVMQGSSDSFDDLEVCGYIRTAFFISNSSTPPLDVEGDWFHYDKNRGQWIQPRHLYDHVQRKQFQWKVLNDLANTPAMECAWTEHQRMCLLQDCDQYGKLLGEITREAEYRVEIESQRQKIEHQRQLIQGRAAAPPIVRRVAKWACQICTCHNPSNQDLCVACDHPRDEGDTDCDSFDEEVETPEAELQAQQHMLHDYEKKYVEVQADAMRSVEYLVQVALGVIYGGDEASDVQLVDSEHAAVRMARPQMPMIERHGNRPTPPPVTIAWQKLGLHFIPLIEVRHASAKGSGQKWGILPENLGSDLRMGCCLQTDTTNLTFGSAVSTRAVFVAELLNDVLVQCERENEAGKTSTIPREQKSRTSSESKSLDSRSTDFLLDHMRQLTLLEKRQLLEKLQEEIGEEKDNLNRQFPKRDFVLPETRMKLSPMSNSSRAATTIPLDQESVGGGNTFSLAPPSPSHSYQSSSSCGSGSSSSSSKSLRSLRGLPNSPCSSNASSPRVSMTLSPRVSPNVSPRVSPLMDAISCPFPPQTLLGPSKASIGRKNSIDTSFPEPVEANDAGFVVGRSRSVSRRTNSRRSISDRFGEEGLPRRNSLSRNIEPNSEDELFRSSGHEY